MKRITGFKNVLVLGFLLGILAVVPVSAAEPDNVDPVQEDVIQEDVVQETGEAEDVVTDEGLIIESPGQDGKGEAFLPSADEIQRVETERTGSIEIQLTEGKKGTTISGITFYCIPVAEIIGGEYELLEEYAQSGIDLNKIENTEQLNLAALNLAEIASGGSSVRTDSKGNAVFKDLEVGVYLIKAEDNEAYDVVTPTLLAIPTWNEGSGEMDYDITVIPKHTPRPDTPTTVNIAPQTNLEDRTPLYAGAAGACILLAVVLVIAGRKRKGA